MADIIFDDEDYETGQLTMDAEHYRAYITTKNGEVVIKLRHPDCQLWLQPRQALEFAHMIIKHVIPLTPNKFDAIRQSPENLNNPAGVKEEHNNG